MKEEMEMNGGESTARGVHLTFLAPDIKTGSEKCHLLFFIFAKDSLF